MLDNRPCTGAGRVMETIAFPRLFCSLLARIKLRFVLPRSVFTQFPVPSDFYFFTTCAVTRLAEIMIYGLRANWNES